MYNITSSVPQSSFSSKNVINIKLNVPEYACSQIISNKEKPVIQNENIKIYDGICEGKGNVSILTLFSFRKNREQFFRLITGINIFLDLKCPFLAQLFGFYIEEQNFNLIFEHLSSSLKQKVSLYSYSENEKYEIIYDIMELIRTLHSNNYQILDLKPSNLFLNDNNKIKIIFPIDNLNVFKEELDEDDEILENLANSEETLIRYTPPEKLNDIPILGNVNDIWMLGCLLIEMFSKEKVWEGYTENVIIKQLKLLQIPKIPRDIPQIIWNIICECLNPFYKTRSNINDIIEHYKIILTKVNKNDIFTKFTSKIMNSTLNNSQVNNNTNISDMRSRYSNNSMNYNNNINNVSSMNDKTQLFTDDYQIRRCYIHPKYIIDAFCTQCNECVCSKCIADKKHLEHNEKVKEMKDYIDDAIKQVETFLNKYKNFLNESLKNFPIDDSIKDYIYKQKDILEMLYNEHLKFINTQFESLHNKIEEIKKIEIDNLLNFKSFFSSKLEEFSNIINDLSSESVRIENEINIKLNDYRNFPKLDSSLKSEIIKTIPCDREILKENKICIMNKFKEYQRQISICDKVKRYFQRAVLNLKENKVYQLNTILDKLQSQLTQTYSKLNLTDYMNSIMLDIDNYALINSRNYIPSNLKDIYIACFKSQKVLSYNFQSNILSILEGNFTNCQNYDQFPNFSRSININGSLYVNGGYDEVNKKGLRNHLSFNPLTLKVKQCSDMIYSHSAHSIVFVPPQYIYVVSGSAMPHCERYDINTNQWKEIPKLNYHRQNCSLFYHNEQYLYAFGGLCFDESLGEFIFVETVERIDIGFSDVDITKNNKWEIVPTVKNKGSVNISKSIMTVLPIHPNKILLVGGLYKDQTYSDEVILFDFEKSEFSLCEDVKLEKPTCFPSKFFLFQGEFAYQFDNDGDIHEFNIKECSFKIVSQHRGDY